ncbi:FAD-dependent oxidoreductase [Streptomyces sp. NA02950]|uniref:NAD(P)/FAD-dependent oxidoreductase n=1 Tax=Streptomyces sp. NA02950 TaxID=2742137 RepID=UPI001591D544|nr:FAD-dependent oxidoreductase [Streptomyces sp. NA02950]QKV97070.1 FAD-dependent oxidoreductase [Streptomyces sp. NA02950]
MTGSVVVIGASLAGVSTARALRGHGFDGEITVIGAEEHEPYDRPPLSKALLAGRAEAADLALVSADEDLRVRMILGRRATGLRPGDRTVLLDDESSVTADAVVVATGARPRTIPLPSPGRGVHVLRSLDDARRLAADLRPGARLVVIGGGFIGCEVAATSRGLGLDVTIVEAALKPLAGALGPEVADGLMRLHREQGIRVECGVGVTAIRGSDRPTGVVLGDGRELAADVVLLAVGAVPETGWLRGSGVALAPDGSVACDAQCRTTVPSVFAVGDVASAEHRFLGGPARVEHWSNAVENADVAAAALLGLPGGMVGDNPPYFWSDQYNHRLQLAGRPSPGDTLTLVDGELTGVGFAGRYERTTAAGVVTTAVVALDRPRPFAHLRRGLVSRSAGRRAS